ncbi:MAG: phospholipid scramblase-related protein [Phycisphaerae bacterium]
MELLRDVTVLAVRQQVEWVEVLADFETQNRYVVCDGEGRELLYAAEHSGVFSRMIFQSTRPFTIDVLDADGKLVLRLRRPWRFYFHQVNVLDADGRPIGTVVRRFSVLRRIYSVLDDNGAEMLRLFGPVLHPWTFRILADGQELGKIRKRWSGLGKEAFTDADNFGMDLPADMDPRTKGLLLGAVFLIDYVHFEKSTRN